ncbi:MAG: hypothetical protein F4Y26_10555 [Gammaproteobacteria bacterium]|nr:hypothetical protein [Gammaproteobacteria bacterium]
MRTVLGLSARFWRWFGVAFLSLGLTVPAVAAAPDGNQAGVVVFGSFVNARFAEREAEAVAERLGVALTVTAVEIDGAVFHRIVSEPLDKAAARQLVKQASQRGQDAWFAALPAPGHTAIAEAAEDVQEPAPAKPAPAPVVQAVAQEPAVSETEEAELQIDAAQVDWTSRFHRIELSGSVSAESRWFYRDTGHAGQKSLPNGFVATPQLYIEDRTGWSFTLSPFYRFDGDDPERTHADLHEAYALFFGALGDGQWEARIGVDRTFWGVVESNNLVDIVNQIDLVEHPDEKSKLGQPMAHFAYIGNWGTMELFGLPYHRQRTFPGRKGRLRFPWIVDDGSATYESADGERHLDLAARYSHSIGRVDFGISAFEGTSREPFLSPRFGAAGEIVLAPHYEQIRQAGLDGQITFDTWLLKLETIHRSGMSNRLGDKEDYASFVFGGEYTLYSLLDSAADLTLLAEWAYDERGRRATTKFDNDMFFGTRLAFNDVQGTELLVSTLVGTDHDSRVLAAELNRRLSDRWSLRLEAVALLELDPWDVLYETRRDSFVEAGLIYSF